MGGDHRHPGEGGGQPPQSPATQASHHHGGQDHGGGEEAKFNEFSTMNGNLYC